MKNLVFICLLFIITSCDKQYKMQSALEEFAVQSGVNLNGYNTILFIPLEGCSSCIQRSIEFYQDNYDNHNILFVFCTYKPYAYDFLRTNKLCNVVIDKKNIAIRNKILTTAPTIYIKETNKFKYLGIITNNFNFNKLH